MKNFKEYIDELEEQVQKIPDEKLLFWGTWLSQAIYLNNEKHIRKYFIEEGLIDTESVFQELWEIVDGKIRIEDKPTLEIEKIQDFDESGLDRTDQVEVAIYELVMSLDAICNYIMSRKRGWEHNIAQAPINIIDVQLQYLDLDILQEAGFKHSLTQKEIACQFDMINLLKTSTRVNSGMKTKFRE